MKAVGIADIKKELQTLNAKALTELCLRLAKHKKENKELLAYLLFEADDEEAYLQKIQQEITESFEDVNRHNLYLAKKTLRRILRTANKHIKFSANKELEAEVLMHFCRELEQSNIPYKNNKILANLYQQQLKKIHTAIACLHEELQYDLLKKAAKL